MTKNRCTKSSLPRAYAKKADMSIQVLIWAALGLAVLIILIAILINKVGFFNQNTPDTCSTPCVETSDCIDGLKIQTSNCKDEVDSYGIVTKDMVCCKKLG